MRLRKISMWIFEPSLYSRLSRCLELVVRADITQETVLTMALAALFFSCARCNMTLLHISNAVSKVNYDHDYCLKTFL